MQVPPLVYTSSDDIVLKCCLKHEDSDSFGTKPNNETFMWEAQA